MSERTLNIHHQFTVRAGISQATQLQPGRIAPNRLLAIHAAICKISDSDLEMIIGVEHEEMLESMHWTIGRFSGGLDASRDGMCRYFTAGGDHSERAMGVQDRRAP